MPLPIMGCGGVMKWQDAAEYLALGAGLLQVCTAVMWNGYGMIDSLTQGLQGYLDKKGYARPAEITGKALPMWASLATWTCQCVWSPPW
jgi:dihydropyrimidine dehydrogenase (NAD+) subunit PreA